VDLPCSGTLEGHPRWSLLANDLQINDQAVYVWRPPEAIARRRMQGTTSTESSTARREIAELEAEPTIHRRAADLLQEAGPKIPLRDHRSSGRWGGAPPGCPAGC
jgi:hypothetical protein